MRFLFTFFIFISFRVAFAQNYSADEIRIIDSLESIISDKNSSPSYISESYVGLSEVYYNQNPDTVITLCRESEKIIKKALKSKISLNEKKQLLEILASAYNNIGFVYERKGDIESALNLYNKALVIDEKIGSKIGQASDFNNLALLYHSQGQTKECIEYFKKSADIYIQIDDQYGYAMISNNLGTIYHDFNQFDSAITYYNNSLLIFQKIGNIEGVATIENNLASIFYQQYKYDSAIVHYNRSLNLYKEWGDNFQTVSAMANLGRCYYYNGELTKGKSYIDESLKIAKEYSFPDNIQFSSSILSYIYENEGDYKEALEMYKLHIKMRDSLNNEATQKAAIQQQAKYEYEKQKAIDDAEHKKEIAIEQEAKEKQTILTYATGGGLGLVGIFLLIVFNRLKVTRKQKNIIEEQKQEVEHQKEVVEKAHTQLEEKNKEITDSIQYAKRIQNAILPPNKVVKEYLQESFILYKPKDIVAGDFYWLEQKDNKVLFAAADCTGHGVPGAMVSVVCNNGLNRSVREYGLTDPGEILNKTREIVVEEFEKSEEEVKDGMDIALCSLEGNTLQYAGAHNPLWIIRKDSNEIEEIKANKQPIGKFDKPEPYTTHAIELQKGDSIYIFSDGYADQFGGEKGKKLKTANFKKLLLSIQTENMQQQKELIDEAFESWKGNLEQLDDVCVIGIQI